MSLFRRHNPADLERLISAQAEELRTLRRQAEADRIALSVIVDSHERLKAQLAIANRALTQAESKD